ncbi:23S rRNA (adenine(2030)-N(6))-methyltransferase RlmJ [Nitratireductor thuwali]|uniref:Ribosomal RNA large subunit methyltransferase J n=1 Tax=Nitratireductor thuwali TaxID=2267699 RepID=A0ABY5MNI8_9HYPH|nr:Ribosomal RNA large subunit methyltransferase J [Nitratireductor thuwali]
MNYRHAFHAGNHTEVFKHAALTLVLEQLLQKPRPFAILDTHAGIGLYDLTADEALRTNEKAAGVERIFGRALPSASMYFSALHAINGNGLTSYPGSPELARLALRECDRLILCELHPTDGLQLKRRYQKDRRISVHVRDGYEAIGALLPPPERRGVVFIDPPFERKDEINLIQRALQKGFQKWATGIFMVWYPIKEPTTGEAVASAAALAGFSSALQAEFCPYQRDGGILAGSGIVICNPPWKIDDKLRTLCGDLTSLLGGKRSSWSVVAVDCSQHRNH